MTRPTTKYMSTVNYQRPCLLNIRFLPLNSGQFSLAVSSVTVNVITLFSRWRPWQAPLWAPLYLLCLPFCLLQRFPFLSPVLFFFFPPLTAVSAFHTWQMIARVKVFSVSILHFPKGEQKRGTSFLQLVSLRKLFRIASFQGRLANAYNPRLSAIVHHNLAIILCLFHLENPYPIKVIQPFQYLLPIKSGRYYLPW